MDHYQILQLNPKATQAEIKLAYRRLAKQFHPDRQLNKDCDRIIALNAAYEILGDSHSRRLYDRQQKLGQNSDFFVSRQARNAAAQQHYRRQKAAKPPEVDYLQWLREVYVPIDSLITKIINPLEAEIEDLAADPFDDLLMEDFSTYLDNCNEHWELAQQKLASQPNPPQVAGVAANLYYCLNHIEDGIKELQWFTMNYNDQYLHTGHEIFRIAAKLHCEAQTRIEHLL